VVKCGDILDEPAEVLVCSANCLLNLSGGVGGELLRRYGMALQTQLHGMLARRSPRAASRGEVFVMTDPKLPYKAVLHAVAVDAWYHTTPDIVREVVLRSLREAARLGAKMVALTALGTGFGDMDLRGFGEVINSSRSGEFAPLEEVVICLEEDRAEELREIVENQL
jgi:O-acetyl-ADP-ribose deacetylase (regulator of RNase III)